MSEDTVAIKILLWKGDASFLKTKSLKPQSELELVVLCVLPFLMLLLKTSVKL